MKEVNINLTNSALTSGAITNNDFSRIIEKHTSHIFTAKIVFK